MRGSTRPARGAFEGGTLASRIEPVLASVPELSCQSAHIPAEVARFLATIQAA